MATSNLPSSVVDERSLLSELANLAPEAMLKWAVDHHGGRVAIITSFQDTGCVMIDMAYRAGLPIRVATIDTLRLHREMPLTIALTTRSRPGSAMKRL